MENGDKLETALNDLVKINEERAGKFRKAAEQIKKNPVLKQMFENVVFQSDSFALELKRYVGDLYIEDPELKGNVFRGFSDIRNAVNPDVSTTILDDCELMEQAVLKAYELILASEYHFDQELQQMLERQKESLRLSLHDLQALNRNLNKINI